MKRRIMAAWLIAAAAAVVLAGCGSGPRPLEVNRYAEDGYLGLTESNPNMPMNPAYRTYSKDRQMMRRALKEIGLDKKATILIQGHVATVTVHLGKLSDEEAEEIRRTALSVLKAHVPRYDFRIRIE